LLFYLESRQRQREISYGLSRRMGLTATAHWWAVTLELGGVLLVSCAIGCVTALIASWIVHARLDPIPAYPPASIFALPSWVLVALLPAAVMVALGGAWRVQRAADSAGMAEVLRAAE
jgi:predicted lysophospholipase L1 biosynthesis ABC-type transport system permease subunit